MNWKHLDILSNDLSVFLRIFTERSISRAARKYDLDAGNLSRSLTRLEGKIGTKLFSRHRTGLEPTQTAHELYRATESARGTFNDQINLSRSKRVQKIRVGFHPIIGFAHFTENMAQKIIELGLQPTFTTASSDDLLEMIKSRSLDFAIVHAPVRFPGLISKSLKSNRLALCSLSGMKTPQILLHGEMRDQKALKAISPSTTRWEINDYFLILKMIQSSDKFMGIVPENMLVMQPKLKVIEHYSLAGKISALSWPGSVGAKLINA